MKIWVNSDYCHMVLVLKSETNEFFLNLFVYKPIIYFSLYRNELELPYHKWIKLNQEYKIQFGSPGVGVAWFQWA